MSRKDHKNAAWQGEIEELGLKAALLERLRFHKGLFLNTMIERTGRSKQTVQKHLNALIKENRITCNEEYNDIHYTFIY